VNIQHSIFNIQHRRRVRGPFPWVFGVECRALNVLRILLVVALAGCAPIHAVAADISAPFDSANKLYEQGKFREAIAAYDKLIDSGPVSPALYFNLGNAFFKAGEPGHAIASYRQAERLSPRDPDVRANLQFVRNQIQGPTLLPNSWQRRLATLTLNEWTLLAAVVLWLWLLTLAAIQFRPALKGSLRHVALIGGIATLLLCGCLGATWSVDSIKTAIVTVPDASVHNGPLDESPNAFIAHDGAELRVLDAKDDWLEVTAGDRHVGWVKRDQVKVSPAA